jgi:hypothetical protein
MTDEPSGAGQAIIDVRTGNPSASDDLAELIGSLRTVSGALDRLWRQALSSASGDLAIRLGDASQGVHRALIALRDDSGRLPLLTPSLRRSRPTGGRS